MTSSGDLGVTPGTPTTSLDDQRIRVIIPVKDLFHLTSQPFEFTPQAFSIVDLCKIVGYHAKLNLCVLALPGFQS